MRTVLAFSGGLDSTTLLYKLIAKGDEVLPVAFAYPSKHNAKELEAAQIICSDLQLELKIFSLDFMKNLGGSALLANETAIPSGTLHDSAQKALVIPGRNSIFAAAMIGYADAACAHRIALAIHADDHSIFPDTRPEWVAALRLLAYHGSMNRISLYAPFSEIRKEDIVRLASQLKVPFYKTWTCYAGQQKPCKVCKACKVRAESFRLAEIVDSLD